MAELYGVDDDLPPDIGDLVVDDDIPATDETKEDEE